MKSIARCCFDELPAFANEDPQLVRVDSRGFRIHWNQKDDPNAQFGWTLVSLTEGVGYVAQSYAGQKWIRAVQTKAP